MQVVGSFVKARVPVNVISVGCEQMQMSERNQVKKMMMAKINIASTKSAKNLDDIVRLLQRAK